MIHSDDVFPYYTPLHIGGISRLLDSSLGSNNPYPHWTGKENIPGNSPLAGNTERSIRGGWLRNVTFVTCPAANLLIN
jgi:hypothetical protein